jgi:hypothetical protein
MLVYITDKSFERFAPLVWEGKDASKRRFYAWHR